MRNPRDDKAVVVYAYHKEVGRLSVDRPFYAHVDLSLCYSLSKDKTAGMNVNRRRRWFEQFVLSEELSAHTRFSCPREISCPKR